jgi:hypothetical protein
LGVWILNFFFLRIKVHRTSWNSQVSTGSSFLPPKSFHVGTNFRSNFHVF